MAIFENNEIWQSVPIKRYSNWYEVSNLGNVRSLDKKVNGFHGKKIKKGRMLKPFVRGEYLTVRLSHKNTSDQIGVSWLVAKAFIPNPFKKKFVIHLNSIKTDNRVTVLMWGDQSDQVRPVTHKKRKVFRKSKFKRIIATRG